MLLKDLLPTIQVAVGPVILISGVGLLLLSMTNRLGRTIDRARQLVDAKDDCSATDRQKIDAQLSILWKRARLQRAAISLSAGAALLAAALIIMLFVSVLLNLQIVFVLTGLFISCMVAIIASLLCFMRDIDLSLHALALELEIQKGKG
jgi:Protein of unknown function (DUF2721)